MNAYNEIDGIPCGADEDLLTRLLRDEWGFGGTVVSDYWAIAFLASTHNIASDVLAAAQDALRAGIDVELPHTSGYGEPLRKMVENGQVPADLLDRAALRVLTQKAELGLLDPNWKPSRYEIAEAEHDARFDSPSNQTIARRLAEESIVLLDNPENLLPLATPRSIAVIGPTADDAHCLFGCYSFPNHVLPHLPDLPLGVAAQTVLDTVRAEFPDAAVRYEQGCAVNDQHRDGFPAAIEAARDADLTILVVGDRSGLFGHGTSGEGCDVATLDLPGVQAELVDQVAAAARKTILVLLSGRPYAIGRHTKTAAATIQSYFPGQEGAAAITGVLSGRVTPSGRLPVQIPGDASSPPSTYLAPPRALKSDGVSNTDPTPAYPFGHGLTYTTFTITDVRPSTPTIPVDGRVSIQATLTNTGSRAGVAVPQLYLSDPVATVTRPVKRLIGFTRVELAAGESSTVEFDVHADLTSFTGRDPARRVEPGHVVLTVAQSAADPGLSAHVELEGDVRVVDHTRTMHTPTTIGGR